MRPVNVGCLGFIFIERLISMDCSIYIYIYFSIYLYLYLHILNTPRLYILDFCVYLPNFTMEVRGPWIHCLFLFSEKAMIWINYNSRQLFFAWSLTYRVSYLGWNNLPVTCGWWYMLMMIRRFSSEIKQNWPQKSGGWEGLSKLVSLPPGQKHEGLKEETYKRCLKTPENLSILGLGSWNQVSWCIFQPPDFLRFKKNTKNFLLSCHDSKSIHWGDEFGQWTPRV